MTSRSFTSAVRRAAEDGGFAQRLFAAGAGEGVLHFQPGLAQAPAEIARADLAHLAAVQELMVHVHQVLVHEGVMAGDLAAEAAGFERRV